MATIRNRLYPFHDVSEHNKINLFSMNVGTALAGQLVKIVTGAACTLFCAAPRLTRR